MGMRKYREGIRAECDVCGKQYLDTEHGQDKDRVAQALNGKGWRAEKVYSRMICLCPTCKDTTTPIKQYMASREPTPKASGAPGIYPITWEHIIDHEAGDTYRLMVPNGWIVKEILSVRYQDETEEHQVALSFVPDPDHTWQFSTGEEKADDEPDEAEKLIENIVRPE